MISLIVTKCKALVKKSDFRAKMKIIETRMKFIVFDLAYSLFAYNKLYEMKYKSIIKKP
jgi:hypothetical protein